MPQQILDYTFVDANLPKEPIGPVARRLLRRYRGTLDHTQRVQETYFWCGPTTAQMILQARGIEVPQSTLARKLGTTTNGTNYVGLFPPVLDDYMPEVLYSASYGPRREALWELVTASIDSGYGIAANIVATKGVDAPDFYPNGDTYHYVPWFGYRGTGTSRQILCADSANFNGVKSWWAGLDQWVSLVSAKGIASAPRRNILGFTDAQLDEFSALMGQLGPS